MRSAINHIIFYFCFTFTIGAQDTSNMSDSLGIEAVIIKATRAVQSDPVTFQNISMQKIENIYSGQDPAVLLQQLSPSVISYSDAGTDIGNYAQFRIRGISQSRINVTLNGVPINDMVDQGVYFSNFSDFGNSVESIQIQRGVGASNVGVASYGGAINFESVNVFNESPRTNLQLTTGSFGTLRTAAEVNTGLMKNKIGVYGRMTRTTVDGYKNHSASDSYSYFGSAGYLGDKDVWKITGFMGKTQNGQSYLPVLISDIEKDPKTNYNHPNDTDDFEQELVQLQYFRQVSGATRIDASLYYGGARGVFPFAIDDEIQYVYGLSNDHYGLLSHLSHQTGNFILKGGIQAYRFDRINYEYLAPNSTNPYDRDKTQKNEISLFSKFNFEISDLVLYADLQLRSVDMDLMMDEILGTGMNLEKNWLFMNLVGGINYSFSPAQSAYISYGRTGREPTRSDLRSGVEQEEYVNGLEIGWRLKSSLWSIGANIFHMTFENEISQVGALMERSYIEIRKNVPESRRSGLELELNYLPSEKISFSLNGAYMDTNVDNFESGQEIYKNVSHIFAPKWVIRPQIELEVSQNLEFILSGRHVSSSFMELANIPSFNLPAHTVLNTQVNIAFNKMTSVSLMINNIFDELYFTNGAPVDFDYNGIVEGPGYRVQPPRHFYLVFSLKF